MTNAPGQTTPQGARSGSAVDEQATGRTSGEGEESQQPGRGHAAKSRRQGERAKAEVADTAEEIKQQATHAADEAQQAAQEAGEEMRAWAAQAADQTREQVTATADRQKDWVGEEVQHVGNAIRSAANHLHETEDDRVADYVEMAADQLDCTANYLRKRDVGGLVDDLGGFARRRPDVFLGGMLVAGLGISRFLKASRHDNAAAPVNVDQP